MYKCSGLTILQAIVKWSAAYTSMKNLHEWDRPKCRLMEDSSIMSSIVMGELIFQKGERPLGKFQSKQSAITFIFCSLKTWEKIMSLNWKWS